MERTASSVIFISEKRDAVNFTIFVVNLGVDV